jgi:hypothetical protein
MLMGPKESRYFAGSGRVGKIVSAAAAKFVTPVTLEVRSPTTHRSFTYHRSIARR